MSLPRAHSALAHSERDLERDWLRQALARHAQGRWALATLPVPAGRALSFWRAGQAWTSASPTVYWSNPTEGVSTTVLGSVAQLKASGHDRVKQLIAGATALWPELVPLAAPDVPSIPPRLYGGMAYAPGAELGSTWSDFPESSFVLPRWVYSEQHGKARLTLAVEIDQLERRPSSPFADLFRVRRLLSEAAPSISAHPLPRCTTLSGESCDVPHFATSVARIKKAIRSGQVRKVVLARQTRIELDSRIDPAWLLERLSLESPRSTVFAIRHGDSTFLGATPEQLISKLGRQVVTEALAGSCSALHGHDTLLQSGKDRREHALVVEGILRALSEAGARASHPAQPEVLHLRHLLHLKTPITATLTEQHHVLDLVRRLHPSPAVAGLPTAPALELIRELEVEGRGWYAAPLGWFDSLGDGRFVVGLRSGLVRGREVTVYAGAGIMPDSDPALELTEIQLKQRTFLRALGAPG